jgi:hypothetical protein
LEMWCQDTWRTTASTFSGTCLLSCTEAEPPDLPFKRRIFSLRSGTTELWEVGFLCPLLGLLNNKPYFLFLKTLLSLPANWPRGQGTSFWVTLCSPWVAPAFGSLSPTLAPSWFGFWGCSISEGSRVTLRKILRGFF